MKKNIYIRKGFTLIELIVVIAIIGILATLVAANFVEVNVRNRDAARKSDLQQIRTALELFRSDAGAYPTPYAGTNPGRIVPCTQAIKSADNSTTYLRSMPCDPKDKTTSYKYQWINETNYTIIACIENVNDKDPNISTDSSYTAQCTAPARPYVIQSP